MTLNTKNECLGTHFTNAKVSVKVGFEFFDVSCIKSSKSVPEKDI